jgi:FkbM family methyltransferase
MEDTVSGKSVGTLKRLIRWHARTRRLGAGMISRLALRYYQAYISWDYHACRNGEYWLIDALAKFNFSCVFDVGANKGDWTERASAAFPSATIHAFEVAPHTADLLALRFQDNDRIVVNRFGLSNTTRTDQLEFHPNQSDVSTLAKFKHSVYATEATFLDVDVVATRDYSAGFSRVDFAKIDCEGHDYQVLMGFGSDITKVQVLQFEVNEFSFFQGITLQDFCDLLDGFNVGRLTPVGVVFKHAAQEEDALFPGNYVAVANDRQDIIAALRWPHGNS